MEEYTVLYRGAPIATLQSDVVDDSVGGDMVPLPAYNAVRQVIADAWRTQMNLGFLPPDGAFVGGVSDEGSRAGSDALRGLFEVCDDLELRDCQGRLLHTEWIWVFGGPTPDDSVSLMASLRDDPDGVPSPKRRPPAEDAGQEPPRGGL